MIKHNKPTCWQAHTPWIFRLPLMSKFDGIAIYPFIAFKSKTPSRTMVEHEKIHIRQQLNGWLIGFFLKYLYYNWRYGYKRNPYEVEAYANQGNWKNNG